MGKLKEQPGKGLIVYASGDLTNTLMEHDLIDEYRLWVHPVVLGRGSSFFEDGAERMEEGTICRHNASMGSRYAMVSLVGASMS